MQNIEQNTTQGLPASTSLREECSRFAADMQTLQEIYQNNSAARATVGQHIAELGQQVEEIKNALRDVQSISMQIKILSLNASIEAARAGQAGKGFAVVATEVGRLSQSTDNSVSNIEASVVSISNLLQQTTQNMAKAGELGASLGAQFATCTNGAVQLKKMIEQMKD